MTAESVHVPGVRNRQAHRTPPLRQLWQVPIFVLGLAALAAVGMAHPYLSAGARHEVAGRLAEVRHLLNQDRPDLDEAISLAQRALPDAPPGSPQLGEAHFLLGSAYLRLAQKSSADADNEAWQKARDQLEQAEHLGVPDADRARLGCRLGLACARAGAPPQRIIDCLTWSIADGADDPFAAYGVLAEAYLHLPTADLRNALDVTRKQLALPNIDETKLAGPRLLAGELLHRLDQAEEARKILARVGPGSPPDILFRARYLRARLLQEDGAWAEAAAQWELVKGDPRWVTVDPGRVLYSLGVCYARLDRTPEAIGCWEAARLRGGEEAQAASLRVAELRLHGDNPTAALDAFEGALRGVPTPGDYHNTLIDLAELRNLFELGCQLYRSAGAYDASQQLAHLYERVALPGVGQELAGQAAEAWGRNLRDLAVGGSIETQRRAEEEARQHYRQAGVAFEAAAALSTSQAEQADWLWRAATDYLEGGDQRQAVSVLERFVLLPIPLERQGRAWYALGEAHRALRNQRAAKSAYEKCIEYPGPYAFRARYRLALEKIEQNRWDDAEETLKQNLTLMQATPDAEAHEQTLVTLASLLYERGNFSAAHDRLQEALDRYPSNPRSRRLRLMYAQCCRRLAEDASQRIPLPGSAIATEGTRQHYRALRLRLLETAVSHYQKLVDDVESLQADKQATAEDEEIVRLARFAVADCRFELGNYPQAQELYTVLARRYQNQVEGLMALAGLWACHGILFQQAQARAVLDQMRTAIPGTTFDTLAENRTRAYWENWVSERSKLKEIIRTPPP